MDEAADVLASLFEVEDDIAHALARPVIGIAPAAARFEHREIGGVEQLCGIRARASREKRRMLEQPDELAFGALAHRSCASFHELQRLLVRHRAIAHAPLDIFSAPFHRAEMAPESARSKEHCAIGRTLASAAPLIWGIRMSDL